MQPAARTEPQRCGSSARVSDASETELSVRATTHVATRSALNVRRCTPKTNHR